MDYKTCTYIRDDGNICNSAAVTDRNLCLYHLSHRARVMRMAQYRARGERFDLQLPPLESMHAVQSALTQLSEALAADMIELKRADRLIRVLNIASRNLLKSDKWPASPYHSDQPAPAVDLTADYGLPNDLDLNLRPEVAFPVSCCRRTWPDRRLSAGGVGSFLRSAPHAYRLTASTAPAVPNTPSAPTTPRPPNSPNSAKSRQPRATKPWAFATKNSSATVVAARSCPTASATPPSRWRRTCASPPNDLAEQKLAARTAQENLAVQTGADIGCPTPASFAGVGPFPDTTRKPVASATADAAAEKEAVTA